MEYTILYEDTDFIVCTKPAGIASQNEKGLQPALTDLLKQYLSKQSGKKGEPYLGIIHRLDKPVGGIMVYAKTKTAAAALSKQITENQIKKHYYAVLCGIPKKPTATLTDYLIYDKKTTIALLLPLPIQMPSKQNFPIKYLNKLIQTQTTQMKPSH